MELPALPAIKLPAISGEAGIRDLVVAMREPRYLRLLGKCAGGGMAAGVLAKRLPPQLALPVALVAGIYIGLEMAAWMEEEAAAKRGPVIDATAESIEAIEAKTE